MASIRCSRGRICPATWSCVPPRIPTRCCSWPTARRWRCASAPAFPPRRGALDLTVQLGRGSVIVRPRIAAKATFMWIPADCRVAVTGTLFGVTARREGLARLGGGGRSTRHPGQPGKDSPRRRPDRDQRQRGTGAGARRDLLEPRQGASAGATALRPGSRRICRRCATPAACWAGCPPAPRFSSAFPIWRST